MADSFNGVVLSVLLQNATLTVGRGTTAWLPFWEQDPNVSERHVPYTNRDIVQFGGRGNFKLSVRTKLASSAVLTSLQALVDGSPHVLVLYGTSYPSVFLTSVGRPETIIIAGTTLAMVAELAFNRQGS